MSNSTIEPLEQRRLLSATVAEFEPNNTTAQAEAITRMPDQNVEITGTINALGDRDWFEMQLEAGDVIGAVLRGKQGLNPAIRVVNSDGELVIGNDNDSVHIGKLLPPESPLPHKIVAATDSEIYRVIESAGHYFVEVSASGDGSAGNYDLDMMVARPAMEKRPVGTRQILFLDFDGAEVNFSKFPTGFRSGTAKLSRLSSFLPGWGLTAADEDAIIDNVVAMVTDKVSTQLIANGLNGDFDATGVPGQFGIEIRNSRDNPDPGSDPLVSRIVVGGTPAETGFPDGTSGLGQYVDVGNLKTDDVAVVSPHFLTFVLQVNPPGPLATVVDLVSAGIGVFASHEAGHIFGCFHTDQSSTDPLAGTHSLMDPNAGAVLGVDGVFGTEDDLDLQFVVDEYHSADPLRGFEDTINTVAFGLSTGKGTVAEYTVGASFITGSGTFKAPAATAESMTKDFLHTDADSNLLKRS